MDLLEIADRFRIVRVGLERGIALYPAEGDWWAHVSTQRVRLPLAEALRRWRPVVVRVDHRVGPSWPILMRPDGQHVSPLEIRSLFRRYSLHGTELQYMAGAGVYHLELLTRRAEAVCERAKQFSLALGPSTSDRAMVQNQVEPYYEFDALTGVVRRSYEACRYVLWNCFGPGGQMPSAFRKLVPLCTRLDQATRDRLTESWSVWGTRIKDYRDCIHHYVTVDFPIAGVMAEQAMPGVWTALTRIPDNPSARAKARFTYAANLDALTFGWEAVCEVAAVLETVVRAVDAADPD